MGILLDKKKKHFLIELGFTQDMYTSNNDVHIKYWNNFTINSLYDLYVEISLEKREIDFMVEYECGGTISSDTEKIPKFEDEFDLVTWLDETITEKLDSAKRVYNLEEN